MNIYISNESSVLTDAQVLDALPAFQRYTDHVRAYWPCPVTLKFAQPEDVPSSVWRIVILDDATVADALGYHDYTPGGKPISYVFAKTDRDYGYNWTITLTHELAEMMADPWISELFQVTDTKLYAKEIADPCEADEFAYGITVRDYPTVQVSDFVTPAWFIPGHPGPVYDRGRHITRPLQLLSGGYISIFVSGKGWTQLYAQHNGEVRHVPIDGKGPKSRPARYARAR